MVIGKTFVWTHLPKTGGNSTLQMFQLMKREILHWDHKEDPKKHMTFRQAEQELGMDFSGKERYLNIRRLPSYILSYIVFQESVYSVPRGDGYARGLLNTGLSGDRPGEPAEFNQIHIDDLLRYYEFDTVTHWLRTEHLAEDFMHYFGRYVGKGLWKNYRIKHARDNVSTAYNHVLEDHFSRDDIVTMYQSCPVWAAVEKEVYGDLLMDL